MTSLPDEDEEGVIDNTTPEMGAGHSEGAGTEGKGQLGAEAAGGVKADPKFPRSKAKVQVKIMT